MLLNGESKSEKSHNYILKSSLENKQKIFEMFNINMSVLEGKLTKLFQPMTKFLVLLDNKFQGQSQKESNLDFVLRLLIRLSETFGSKYGLCLNSGTLLRCPYYFSSEMFNV